MRSFAIVTTEPNELCAALHNRMPVVLAPRGLAGMARRGTGRRGAAEGAIGPLPCRRHGLLAGQRARRQRQEQRSVADRADHHINHFSGSIPYGWLTSILSHCCSFFPSTNSRRVGKKGAIPRSFSISGGIRAIIAGFNLPPDSWFWLFAACLLVGIMRQEHRPLDIIGRTPQALAEALIARVQ